MSRTLQLVMVTNAVTPDKIGGLERYVRELSTALAERGHDVTILTKRLEPSLPADEVAADGVRVVRYSVPDKKDPLFAAKYPFRVAQAIRSELARRPNALVHGHFSVPSLVPALNGRPFVFTFHAPVYKELLRERQGSYALPAPAQRAAVGMLRAAERLVMRRASELIVLSDFMRSELALLDERAGVRAHRFAGGVDTERFGPGPTSPEPWAVDAEPLLLSVRRLTPRTGVHELVQAMPAIVAAHPRVRLAVLSDGMMRPEIERTIECLGLQDHVWLTGRVSDQELVEWYRRADLTVVPTQELEGFGLTTAEAMACGSPVLVTPAGANPELANLLDPRLVTPGTKPADIASQVMAVFADPELMSMAAGKSRAVIVPDMGWDAIANRHEDLYARVLKESQ